MFCPKQEFCEILRSRPQAQWSKFYYSTGQAGGCERESKLSSNALLSQCKIRIESFKKENEKSEKLEIK